MKYLKCFESNKYYKEISYEDYVDKVCGDYASKLEDSEIGEIKNIISQILCYNLYVQQDEVYIIRFWPKNRDFSVSIRKFKDEWYYVDDRENKKYYKCDQFESVLVLLKDIL